MILTFVLFLLVRDPQEVLTFIEERLGELELEKKELTEYEQLDKQRRALEYSLYDKEYKKVGVFVCC